MSTRFQSQDDVGCFGDSIGLPYSDQVVILQEWIDNLDTYVDPSFNIDFDHLIDQGAGDVPHHLRASNGEFDNTFEASDIEPSRRSAPKAGHNDLCTMLPDPLASPTSLLEFPWLTTDTNDQVSSATAQRVQRYKPRGEDGDYTAEALWDFDNDPRSREAHTGATTTLSGVSETLRVVGVMAGDTRDDSSSKVVLNTGAHSATMSDSDDDPTEALDLAIGSFHRNGKFKCLQLGCARKSFNRQAELKRHYDTIHADQKPEYWCQHVSYPRSRANGGHAFTRKDKLRDHVRKVHVRR